jgi:photosystem II stability/assembly factor-like uncharacterized protein
VKVAAHKNNLPFFVLALGSVFFVQVSLASEALGQKKAGQLEAEKLPASQMAFPKGEIHAFLREPNNPLKILLGTAEGLEGSENGGKSWRPIEVGGTHEEVFALAQKRSNPDTLFAGRGDGLWRSDDGGASWISLPYSGSVPVSIALAESQPNTLYLGTARSGVYKSVDGGYHWTEAARGLPEARAGGSPEEIHTLAIDPSDGNILYASVPKRGIYRSVDGGASWHEFNRGLATAIARAVAPLKIAANPDDPKGLFLVSRERIHSHLIVTRLYTLAEDQRWLPVEVKLPSQSPVLGVFVNRANRKLEFWGKDATWQMPLPEKAKH